jgi:hypothetical protein
MRLQVRPLYGWGWSKSDGAAMDVPPSFALEVTVTQEGDPFTSVLGRAPPGDHPLAGLWLILSRRHGPFGAPFDGNCNLFAFDHKPAVPRISEALTDRPVMNGYVQIDEIMD